MDTTKPVIKLDWSRLLGFDQATPQADAHAGRKNARSLARLGAKVGTKGATARPRAR